MSFTDYIFLPFLFAICIVYYTVPLKVRWFVLLCGSVLFYFSWGIELFPCVFITTFICYFSAKRMEGQVNAVGEKAYRDKCKKRAKFILWLTIIVTTSMLIYVKGQHQFVNIPKIRAGVRIMSNLYQRVVHWCNRIPLSRPFVRDKATIDVFSGNSFFVPLGISYYTLSMIGYLADVYWKKEKAERNVLKLFLFALYFPKIVEGPISKHRFSAEQLNTGHEFDYKLFCFGLQRMAWGYFKKLAIADRISVFVNNVYGNYETKGGAILLTATIFGAVQLYCDFSGCMDIALGASEMFGIKLEENFNHPFFSRTAAEFWRRWHITLGTWYKDYIYLPLASSKFLIKQAGFIKKHAGKSFSKAFSVIIPLYSVWILTGMWHATGLNYLVWGLYWGTIIVISTLGKKQLAALPGKLKINVNSAVYKRFQIIRTFMIFIGARIITIPTKLLVSLTVFKRICTGFAIWQIFDGTLFYQGLSLTEFMLSLILIIALYKVSKAQENGTVIREKIAGYPITLRWCVYILEVLAVLILGVYGPGYDAGSFIYMRY